MVCIYNSSCVAGPIGFDLRVNVGILPDSVWKDMERSTDEILMLVDLYL